MESNKISPAQVKRQFTALEAMREEDAKLARSYLSSLEAQGKSLSLRFKRSWQLRKIYDLLGKPLATATELDLEELAKRIHTATDKKGRSISQAYKFDLFITTRSFYQWLLKKRNPELLANFYMRKPAPALIMPSQLITEAEVLQMLSKTSSLQDKAFLSLLYGVGARIGEMLNLSTSDVIQEGSQLFIRLNGKTGERLVPVGWPVAVENLDAHLQNHPNPQPDAALWLTGRGNRLTYGSATGMISRIAALAGIGKRLNPHTWRHSRATELAKTLTDQQLKYYFGWQPNSDMAARYIHPDRSMVASKFQELYGKEDETQVELDISSLIVSVAEYLKDKRNLAHFKLDLQKKGKWHEFERTARELASVPLISLKIGVPLERFELSTYRSSGSSPEKTR